MHRVKKAFDETGFSDAARTAMQGGCACLQARMRARQLTRRYDTALKPHGLTVGQFSMLAAIAASGRLSVQRLANVLAMDHSTTSRALAILVRQGVLEASAHPKDGRKSVYALTPSGVDRLNAAAVAWERVQAETLAAAVDLSAP